MIFVKFTKNIALGLAAISLIGMFSGCKAETGKKEEGKINISVGNWPDETNPEGVANQEKLVEGFEKENPDINVIGDTFRYDTKTFTMKAAAGQLPTMYKPWFTEINQIIDAGYAADITELAKEHGYTDALNPELMKYVTDENGRVYGLPTDAYVVGLALNKKIFEDAGLVNEDGSLMTPDTYEDVAEFSRIIKEKTGAAGLVLPTTNNCGGWLFLNIAWSYGVEFAKQREDGSWQATFDTKEARDALQYVKDLKWKYNGIHDDTVIDQGTMMKYFGTYQGAMVFTEPNEWNWITAGFGMDVDDIYFVDAPKGPAGRYAQMGGNLWMFSPKATEEEIDAGMKWLKFTDFSPELTDKEGENLKLSFENILSSNGAVLPDRPYPTWVNQQRIEKEEAIRAEYANVNKENYAEYLTKEDLKINLEPVLAQQLYSVLDKCIQEVFTNENADIDKLITDACHDYQVNHLDQLEK